MVVMVVVVMILGWGMVVLIEGSRVLLNLGKLIDYLIDCLLLLVLEDVLVVLEFYNVFYFDLFLVSSYIFFDVLFLVFVVVYEFFLEY